MIHYVALGYPDAPDAKTQAEYRSFFESLQFVLPCEACARHYREILQATPVTDHLRDRETLLRWTFAIHNQVNLRLRKPTLDYHEALKLYTKRQYPTLQILWKVLMLFLLIAIVYAMLR